MCKVLSWIIRGIEAIGCSTLALTEVLLSIICEILVCIVEGKNPFVTVREIFKGTGELISKCF